MLTAELNNNRRLGCEFEMTIPLNGKGSGKDVQQSLAKALSANGFRAVCRPYSNRTLPFGIDFAVEYDNSVCGESQFSGITWLPIELKTRILNGIADWERVVPDALQICQCLGAQVNDTCGFHLHIEMMEVKQKASHIRSLFNLFHRFETVIYGLVAPSRTNNHYAKAICEKHAKLLHGIHTADCFCWALDSWDNYRGLNLDPLFLSSHHALARKPRIELRYHQGTLSPVEARHWVRFCLRMIDHACERSCQAWTRQIKNDRQGLERLLVSCGFKMNNKIYQRICPELQETRKYYIRKWKEYYRMSCC